MPACLKVLLLAILTALAHLFVSSPALAASQSAANCSSAAVTSAINLAASGDAVLVPAGACTWTSPVTLPATKDLTLLGAGAGATVITCTTRCLDIATTVTTRVARFAFVYSGTNSEQLVRVGFNSNVTSGKTFRIDHNTFTSVSAWGLVDIFGGGPTIGKHPTGLVDHNTFSGVAVHVNGSNFLRDEGTAQDSLWSQTTVLGDGTDVVYIEDNTFTGDRPNYVDGNYGGRYVVRFNTMSGHATGVEIHSVQGNNRAVQRWEIYKNTVSKPGASFYPVAFIRGGTGVAFGNLFNADFGSVLLLDNVRSGADPGGGVGACNGSSAWDQNLEPNGYACRDQVGRGRDTVMWTGPPAPYTQSLQPVHFWDNKEGPGTPLSVTINEGCSHQICLPPPGNNSVHLVENRDWYRDNASFNGTTGVGTGTFASMPGTCTPGVAYWATDRGDWNSLQAGADGELYKCTAAGVFELYYRPYTYPHPLQAGGAIAPAAPSGLTVR